LEDEPVTCIASCTDGKHIKYEKEDGSYGFEKANRFIAYHIRKPDQKFNRKLLTKLPKISYEK